MKQTITLTCPDPTAVDKVRAIKGLRNITGSMLKEAKEFIEAVMEGNSLSTRLSNNLSERRFKDGVAMIESAGFKVIDDPIINHEKIKERIKDTIAFCVECEDFDTVKKLIDVLQGMEQ